MKKFLVIALTIILSCSLFACSGKAQTVSTGSFLPSNGTGYEKLIYNVSESGKTEVGTLTLIAERMTSDTPCIMPVINEDQTINMGNVFTAPNGSIYLFSKLEFQKDELISYTICTSGFRPLYSFKALVVNAEKTAYTGNDTAPVCISYAMYTTYENGTNNATSVSLRQKNYGETDTTKWTKNAQNFENIAVNTTSTFWDINQMYYAIRGVNTLFDNNFQYSFRIPMALESNVKTVVCSGKNNQSKSRDSFPYINEKYADAPDKTFSYTAVTIYPTGEPVTGSSIQVYYSEQDLHSDRQTDLTKDGECPRVPIYIVENQAATTSGTANGRGTISYSLVDICVTK